MKITTCEGVVVRLAVVVHCDQPNLQDGDGDDDDEACQVWGQSDLMGRCMSLCDVVMGGWRWAEMAVIAEKSDAARYLRVNKSFLIS
jgi:hypothetical protein